jgi:E3 ubiquitin-protein ligase RFWD2
MISDDCLGTRSQSSSIDRTSSGLVSISRNVRGGIAKPQFGSLGSQKKNVSLSGLNSQHMSQSGLAVVRKKRVHAQVSSYEM